MLSLEDVRTLETLTNTSWGRSSTEAAPTRSVQFRLEGDAARLLYTTIVTYQAVLTHADMAAQYDEAQQYINGYIAELKKQFKTETGRSLKLKVVDVEPTVEQLDVNTFSSAGAVRTAYYRCNAQLELG